MPGKRAESVLGIRAYIKSRSQLGLKTTYFHREVCNNYEDDQISFSTVYRWVAKFKSGLQQLKDDAHPIHPVSTTTKRNIQTNLR